MERDTRNMVLLVVALVPLVSAVMEQVRGPRGVSWRQGTYRNRNVIPMPPEFLEKKHRRDEQSDVDDEDESDEDKDLKYRKKSFINVPKKGKSKKSEISGIPLSTRLGASSKTVFEKALETDKDKVEGRSDVPSTWGLTWKDPHPNPELNRDSSGYGRSNLGGRGEGLTKSGKISVQEFDLRSRGNIPTHNEHGDEHPPHDEQQKPQDKNVHPGHPYENKFEAVVTGEVGKGLPPLPSKEEWRKPSKEMPKLPTWDNKETITTGPNTTLTSNIQKNNDSSAILLQSYRADGIAPPAPMQANNPNARVIEIKVRGRPNPAASPPVNPPGNPSKAKSLENSAENITVIKSENTTANSPIIHLANLTAEPPPAENATESSTTAKNLGGIPPLATNAIGTPPITNATTLTGIPPLAPVTGGTPSAGGAVANTPGSMTAGSPEGSTSNVIKEKSSMNKNGTHKRSRIRRKKRKGTKRSSQPRISNNHRRHLNNGPSHHHHHHHGNNRESTETGFRRSHIRHTPVMQVLKDFSYKISHLGQREGDAEDSHLSPAEIII